MALTTQLRVLIEGDASSLIGSLNKAQRASTGVFTEVSRSAKAEFAAATREADKAFKEVARLQSMAKRADAGGQSGLATALRSQAAAKGVEYQQFASTAVAAEKKIQAEAAKTVASHAAEATGVSKLGSAYAQQGGAISHFFGAFAKDGGAANKTVGALGSTIKSFATGGPTSAIATLGSEVGKLGKSAVTAGAGATSLAGGLGGAGAAAAGAAAAVGVGAIGFGILATTVASGIKHFEEFAAEVRKVQNIVGGTAENASLLAGQFRHFGIDVDAGSKALGIFATNASNNGGKKLRDLGIQIAHTKNGQIDLTKTLENAGDVFKRYGKGAEGAALARNAFGRGGLAIVPLLKAERSEIEAINRATSKQGLKFNDKDLKDAKDLSIATRELHHSFEGLQVSAAKGLAPLFTTSAEGATNLLNDLNQVTQKVGGLGGIIKHSVGGIGNALGSLSGAPFLGSAVDSLSKFGEKSGKAAKDQAVLQQAFSDTEGETTGLVADLLNAGNSLDEINFRIQQSGKSVEELGNAANISPEFDAAASSIAAAGTAAALAGEQADTLHAKLDLLGQGAISLAGSQTNLAGAQAALAKGLADSGNSFDNATDAGRAHRQLIENDASAILGNIAALQQQGASVGEVSAAWDLQVGALKRTLSQAGLTDQQINDLLRDYGLIPATKDTIVTAQTADALKKLADLQYAYDHLHATDLQVNIAGGLPLGSILVPGKGRAQAEGGKVQKGILAQVGERGPEMFVPSQRNPVAKSAAARIATQADKEARDGLVRLGIPDGIAPKSMRSKGSPALLLGTHGPQMFTPPTDGVIVKASDTQRLKHTHDADVITEILKRAGLDHRSLDALTSTALHRATGGKVEHGKTYLAGEQGGPEAFVPKFHFGSTKATPSIVSPGVKRGSDGSYNITIGDTHLKVEAGTSGSAKGINKSDVDKIVERKQAELVQELVAAMRSG